MWKGILWLLVLELNLFSVLVADGVFHWVTGDCSCLKVEFEGDIFIGYWRNKVIIRCD